MADKYDILKTAAVVVLVILDFRWLMRCEEEQPPKHANDTDGVLPQTLFLVLLVSLTTAAAIMLLLDWTRS